MPENALKVAVVQLPELVNPMREFDIWVAAQFGKCGGRLKGTEKREIEFAEQGAPRNCHLLDSTTMGRMAPGKWRNNSFYVELMVNNLRKRLQDNTPLHAIHL